MRKPACTLTLALVVTLAACGGDEKLTLAAMAGTWDATEYLNVDQADHNNTFDVLADLGVSLSAQIRGDGRVIISLDGAVSGVDTTIVTLSGNVLDINGFEFNVALSGDDMTWTGVDTFPFDFDGDGTNEEAFERARWHRR
jgi:hypothetical protein